MLDSGRDGLAEDIRYYFSMRSMLTALVLAASMAFVGTAADQSALPVPEKFSIVEATIPDMQAAMKSGRLTSRQLV